MRLAAWLAVAAAGLLAACSTAESRLAPGSVLPEVHASVPLELGWRLSRTPACCESLAQLPYRDAAPDERPMRVRIDQDSPAFVFEGGKSYLAAFRLPAAARPLLVQVQSRRIAHPGVAGLLGVDAPRVFRPAVLILDARFRVRRTISPTWTNNDECLRSEQAPVFDLRFDVSGPPSQEAYLVITTADALRALDGELACGRIQHGYSPIGELDLHFERLDIDDGRVVLEAPGESTGSEPRRARPPYWPPARRCSPSEQALAGCGPWGTSGWLAGSARTARHRQGTRLRTRGNPRSRRQPAADLSGLGLRYVAEASVTDVAVHAALDQACRAFPRQAFEAGEKLWLQY